MRYESYSKLKFSNKDRVLTVTIDSGAQMNAVNDDLHRELAQVFTDLQNDPECDIVILTGAGDAFCAGGDMTWFQEMIDDPRRFRSIAPDGKRIVFSLRIPLQSFRFHFLYCFFKFSKHHVTIRVPRNISSSIIILSRQNYYAGFIIFSNRQTINILNNKNLTFIIFKWWQTFFLLTLSIISVIFSAHGHVQVFPRIKCEAHIFL